MGGRYPPGDRDFGTLICLSPEGPETGASRVGASGEPGILKRPGQGRAARLPAGVERKIHLAVDGHSFQKAGKFLKQLTELDGQVTP